MRNSETEYGFKVSNSQELTRAKEKEAVNLVEERLRRCGKRHPYGKANAIIAFVELFE